MKNFRVFTLPALGVAAGFALTSLGLPPPARSQSTAAAPVAATPTMTVAEALALPPGGAVFLDTRTRIEYDWMRIANSFTAESDYLTESDLLERRSKDAKSPALVFYATGGGTVAAAAVQKAMKLGFGNVFVLEGGMDEWSKAAPNRTLLGGRPLDSVDPKERPSAAQLEAFCFAPAAFLAAVRGGNYTVIDLRYPVQRGNGYPAFSAPGAIPMTPTELVTALKDNNGSVPASKLLLFDLDGRRLPGLQFYLNRFGITDYHFAKGGTVALAAAEAAPAPPATPATTPRATPPAR